jgi:DNA phosphorothioation-associated putative methyltransferase
MSEVELEIRREKTAIFRDRLSTPMQSLLKHRFLDGEHAVFDYGCGRGDDLRSLEVGGITVNGWDPHFLPEAPKIEADVVNLGFVINVIEDPKERAETLKSAYGLSRTLLVVSVMLQGQSQYKSCSDHEDGVVTQIGTFQKYYSSAEIRQFVEKVLGREPITVSPGCLFVFRKDEDEQLFLEQRHSHHVTPDELVKWALPSDKRLRIYERNKDLLEDFWKTCLKLGRLPANDEYAQIETLKENVGSPKKAMSIIAGPDREEGLKKAGQRRIDDLIVFFALNLFERRKSFATMPAKIQRDIKAFFGNYQTAVGKAKSVLFSAGKAEEMAKACQVALDNGIGYLEQGRSLTLVSKLADRLPPLLRIYMGCAAQLTGEIDEADMIKIHIASAKLTLTSYDDFENKRVPLMLERIKIDMRNQSVDFFEYGDQYQPHPVYFKSRYMNRRSKAYKQQQAFDEKLALIDEVNDYGEFGPSVAELDRILLIKKLKIEGFDLVPR